MADLPHATSSSIDDNAVHLSSPAPSIDNGPVSPSNPGAPQWPGSVPAENIEDLADLFDRLREPESYPGEHVEVADHIDCYMNDRVLPGEIDPEFYEVLRCHLEIVLQQFGEGLQRRIQLVKSVMVPFKWLRHIFEHRQEEATHALDLLMSHVLYFLSCENSQMRKAAADTNKIAMQFVKPIVAQEHFDKISERLLCELTNEHAYGSETVYAILSWLKFYVNVDSSEIVTRFKKEFFPPLVQALEFSDKKVATQAVSLQLTLADDEDSFLVATVELFLTFRDHQHSDVYPSAEYAVARYAQHFGMDKVFVRLADLLSSDARASLSHKKLVVQQWTRVILEQPGLQCLRYCLDGRAAREFLSDSDRDASDFLGKIEHGWKYSIMDCVTLSVLGKDYDKAVEYIRSIPEFERFTDALNDEIRGFIDRFTTPTFEKLRTEPGNDWQGTTLSNVVNKLLHFVPPLERGFYLSNVRNLNFP